MRGMHADTPADLKFRENYNTFINNVENHYRRNVYSGTHFVDGSATLDHLYREDANEKVVLDSQSKLCGLRIIDLGKEINTHDVVDTNFGVDCLHKDVPEHVVRLMLTAYNIGRLNASSGLLQSLKSWFRYKRIFFGTKLQWYRTNRRLNKELNKKLQEDLTNEHDNRS